MHPIIPCTETILQNVVPANVCAARRELRIPENFPPWATETPAVNRQLGSGRDIASASSTRPRHPAHVLSCAMDACLRNETEIFEQAVVATINVPIPNDVRSPVQTICDQFVVWGLDFQCDLYASKIQLVATYRFRTRHHDALPPCHCFDQSPPFWKR